METLRRFEYDCNGYRNRQDVLNAIENRHKWLQLHENTPKKGKIATPTAKRRKSNSTKSEEASHAS